MLSFIGGSSCGMAVYSCAAGKLQQPGQMRQQKQFVKFPMEVFIGSSYINNTFLHIHFKISLPFVLWMVYN